MASKQAQNLAANTEVELKLRATPELIREVARQVVFKDYAEGDKVIKNLESTYFDTPDLRLRGRGMALRVRKDGNQYIQTLKTSGKASGALAKRGEWEAVVPGPAPDLGAIDDLNVRERVGLILPGELLPVFANRVHREIAIVDGKDELGRPRKIEIAVDIGEMEADGSVEEIAEIELELKEGASETVFDLALALHRNKGMQVETRSKAERGFALSTGERPAWLKAEVIRFQPDVTIDHALAAVFEGCFKHWVSNEPAAVDSRDPEGVHQMRVGLRRLRSALTIFCPILPEDALEWLKPEAKFAINALGPCRDIDVFVEDLLEPMIERFPGEACLETLLRKAQDTRFEAYTQARKDLASPRYTDFVLRFGGWVEGHRWRDAVKDKILNASLAAYADKLLEKEHRKILKLGQNFSTMVIDDRHRVRIALKKLRYTSEFFASLYPGAKTRRYLKSLSQLQNVLGHLNDVAVAEDLIEDLAARADNTEERVNLERATGLFAGWYNRGLDDSEAETVARWQAFAGSKPFWHAKA